MKARPQGHTLDWAIYRSLLLLLRVLPEVVSLSVSILFCTLRQYSFQMG